MKCPSAKAPRKCLFTPFLQSFLPAHAFGPKHWPPRQSLTLALSSGRTSEMALAAPGRGRWSLHRLPIRISGSPLPGLSCCIISQDPRCLFGNGVVFLELKSNSALRGTSLWMRPQLEPSLDRRRVGAVPWASSPPRSAPLGPFCWRQDTLSLPCPSRLLPACRSRSWACW